MTATTVKTAVVRNNAESFGEQEPTSAQTAAYEAAVREYLGDGWSVEFEYLPTLGHYTPVDVEDEDDAYIVQEANERAFVSMWVA